MSREAEGFSDIHRKVMGGCLQGIERGLDQARELGLQSETLTTLYAEIERLKSEVGTARPPPPPHLLRAVLVEVLTLTYELRPEALGAYGSLPDESASYLEERTRRLGELAERRRDEAEGKRAGGDSR